MSAWKALVQKQLFKRGYVLDRHDSVERRSRDVWRYLAWMIAEGVAFDAVYDIGAYRGEWTLQAMDVLPANTPFVLVEANEAHCRVLEETGHRVLSAVLSDHEGPAAFYSSGGTGDSLFRENSRHYDDVESTTCMTATLAGLIAENSLPNPSFIKLDTQGAELAILRGAETLLPQVRCVYMEVPILRYNAGAPTTDEYVRAMSAWGFVPAGLFEVHIGRGAVIQVDMLFVSRSTFRHLFGEEDSEWIDRMLPSS